MSDACIDFERIPGVLDLPFDDPRRRHVETCPRCGAILASYRAFIREEFVAGYDPDDAHERLTAFVRSEIGTPREKTGSRAAESAPGRGGLLSRIMGIFPRRPAWAAALLVVVAALGIWWRPWTPDRIALRGTQREGASQPLTLSAPQRLPEGSIRLEWTPMTGADTYQVRLYDKGLKEIARLDPTSETGLIIDRSALLAATPDQLIWRVFALRRGDNIGSSDPASLGLR